MKKLKQILTVVMLMVSFAGISQVKYGNNPTSINANSLLELESTNKGLLIPRMALTQTSLPAPLSAHVQGMTIFNTATINDVVPGVYINDGTKWINLGGNTSNYWNINGNAATAAGTNFIGTTDNTDLVFKIKNVVSGWINNSLSNASFGFNSLPLTTTGTNNAAFGADALNLNTTGAQNTAIGFSALQNNSAGYLNTAVGASSMQYNLFGGLNCAFGTQSLQSNFSGTNNTALGYVSLSLNSDGNNNTSVGSGSLSTNTHGNNNTAVGYQSLQYSLTGSDNVALGYNAGTGLNSGSNNIIIGDNAQPSSATVSNEVTLGNTSSNSYRMYTTGWINASDRKLKHGIKDLPVGLAFVMALKPVEFIYNNSKNESRSLGFVAQDVQADMQQSNMNKSYGLVSNLDDKYLGINTTELIPVLTKAIQEQQKIIEEQNKRIERLEKLLLNK